MNDSNKPHSEELRRRTSAFMQDNDILVSKLATMTGIGYFRLLRFVKGETVSITLDDAKKIEAVIE